MSWRPDNWPKIKQSILPLRMESLDPAPFKLIEAGADAMLKALKEQGIKGRIKFNAERYANEFYPDKDCHAFQFDPIVSQEGRVSLVFIEDKE